MAEPGTPRDRTAVRSRAARFERWKTRLSDTTARLEADATRSLGEGRFALHYQPRVDPAGDVVGMEALLRWHDAQRGIMRPDVFLPRLTTSPVGRDIGRWAIVEACRQAHEWEADRPPAEAPIRVAVNVDLRDLLDPVFDAFVLDALAAAGVGPDLLQLEVEPEAADPTLLAFRSFELRDHGLHLALDAVGPTLGQTAGFLPVDAIHIARRWVGQVDGDPCLAGALRALTQRAHDRGVLVGAVGVERAGQAEVLTGIGVDRLQGDLYGEPLPADELGWCAEEPPRAAHGPYDVIPTSGLPRRPRGVHPEPILPV